MGREGGPRARGSAPTPPSPPSLSPEFLNRLDEIIVFRQLTKGEVKEIADIMLREVGPRREGRRTGAARARAWPSRPALSPTTRHDPSPPPPTFLLQVFKRAEEKGIKIDVTERFKDRLVDEGYNPAYGARPLRRAIMRLLEDSMAERMLAGDIKEGDAVIIDVDAQGDVSVLNGDRTMTTSIDSTPAGIS